jgi:hypothetical protein
MTFLAFCKSPSGNSYLCRRARASMGTERNVCLVRGLQMLKELQGICEAYRRVCGQGLEVFQPGIRLKNVKNSVPPSEKMHHVSIRSTAPLTVYAYT